MTETGDGLAAISAMHNKTPHALTLVYTGYPEFEAGLDVILHVIGRGLDKPEWYPLNVTVLRRGEHARSRPRPASYARFGGLGTGTVASQTAQHGLGRTCRNSEAAGHIPKDFGDVFTDLHNVPLL